jgi:hypothetical protein
MACGQACARERERAEGLNVRRRRRLSSWASEGDITLLSQAMHQLQTIGNEPLAVLDNVRISGFGARGGLMSGRNVLLKNTIEGWSFENSVIHFDPSTKLINVQFTHCVFIFPADSTPPKSLQDIGAILLASDLESAKIAVG